MLTNQWFQKRFWFSSFLAVCVFLLCPFKLSSQPYPLLKGAKANQKIYFQKGAHIKFEVIGSELPIEGAITNFNETTISLGANTYNLTKIKKVIITRRGAAAFSSLFIAFGVAFAGLDIINSATNNQQPIVDTYVLQMAAIPLAAGIALRFFKYKKIEMEDYTWEYLP